MNWIHLMIHLFQEKYKQGTYDSDRMEADIISLLYIPEPNKFQKMLT